MNGPHPAIPMFVGCTYEGVFLPGDRLLKARGKSIAGSVQKHHGGYSCGVQPVENGPLVKSQFYPF